MKKCIFFVLLVLFLVLIARTSSDTYNIPNYDSRVRDWIVENPLDFSNTIQMNSGASSSKTTLDSSLAVIVNGDSVLIRTRFNDEYDLLQHIEVFSETEIGDNHPFEWKYSWLIPKTNSNNSIASIYSGYKVIHQMGDDACPRRYNSSLMGGNHGLDAMQIVKSESHNRSSDDIGVEWCDYQGTKKFYIVHIPNDDSLWILPENKGTKNKWNFYYTVSSVDTLYNYAHTDSIVIQNAFSGQMEPVIRDQNKKLFYYNISGDSTEIVYKNFNVYYGSEVKIFESYNIANPDSSLKYITENAGNWTSQPDLNSGEPELNYINTFKFDKWGGCVIDGYTKNYNDIYEYGYGFIQSASLRKDNFNNIFYYMPNVTAITDTSSRTWALDTLENFENGPSSDLYFTSSYWTENDSLPYRMIQFLGNGRDTLSVGYQMAYDTKYGDAKNSIRSDNATVPWRIASTKKSYPNIIDSKVGTTTGNTELNVRSFRGYFDPKKYSNNASCVQFFKTGEGKYKLFLDYHKSVELDCISLPEELHGMKIEPQDCHSNLQLRSDYVSEYGIYVRVVNDYGYGVFELEAYEPKTIYVTLVEDLNNDPYYSNINASLIYNQLWKAILDANDGDIVLVDGGIYTDYYPEYLSDKHWCGIKFDNKYNITVRRDPNSTNNNIASVLDCSGLDSNSVRYGVLIRSSSSIHIDGLEIKNVQQSWDTNSQSALPAGGIVVLDDSNQIPSTNLIFENLNIHNIGGSGLVMIGDCSNTSIINCDSHDNCDSLSEDRGDDADGFGYSTGIGEGVIFIGCRSWRNSDDGFDLWGTEVPVVIDSCWAFNNGYDPENDPETFYGNGVGFKLGFNRSGNATHTVQNCSAVNNQTNGFDSNGSTSVMKLYNNTSYNNNRKNGNTYNFREDSIAAENIIKNNISYGDFTPLNNLYSTGSNNSWNLSVNVNDSDFVSLDSLHMDDDRDSNGNLPVNDFLKLHYSSDLIDKGVDVGLPYFGSAPDLGCFESDYYIHFEGDTLVIHEDSTYVIDEGYTFDVDDELVIKMMDNSIISIGNYSYLVFQSGSELIIDGVATITGDLSMDESVYVNINDNSRLVIETDKVILPGTRIQLGENSKFDIIGQEPVKKKLENSMFKKYIKQTNINK